jgi:hypothetical protein
MFSAMLPLLTPAIGSAADAVERGAAIAVIDFNYIDTSGEERDQRSEHEARLKDFMSALRRDLAAGDKLRSVAPVCRPEPCSLTPSTQGELLGAAREAGADVLLLGGIHKVSTLVQQVRIQAIDTKTGQVVLDRFFTFRGDTDEAWRRAEAFISDQLGSLLPRRYEGAQSR